MSNIRDLIKTYKATHPLPEEKRSKEKERKEKVKEK